jgi:hypothetical protein
MQPGMSAGRTLRRSPGRCGVWRTCLRKYQNAPKESDTTRIPFPAAQGVTGWSRKIGDRWYQFTLVTDGWWGVGETGTLRVYRQLVPCGDWYVMRTAKLNV